MAYGVINSDLMTTSDGVSSAGLYGFKNRLINGDMRIDQRNAGASVTPTNTQYLVDRWNAGLTAASKFSVQQNAASVTPPTGFTNYLGATSLSAYSVSSGDAFLIQQNIEGLNIADLAFGTASAATVTLSFLVRSSLTGTFGGSLSNSGSTRSYPFTYTINSANTWEKETITIAGDTSGTWLTTNGVGIVLRFGLGSGSTYSGTAGAWAGANYVQPTGSTSVVGTNGATFYITGVQLEKGTTATSFDYLDYGRSLMQCQRYYWTNTNAIFIPGHNAPGAGWPGYQTITFPTTMRASPTVSTTFSGTTNANVATANINTSGFQVSATSITTGNFSSTYSANNSASVEL